jgi:molecular chaperone IbpA
MTNITSLASSYGLDRILPSTLGFDHVFATLDNAAHLLTSTASSFPPVNIIKTGEYTYNVELAVAGYKKDEIEITAEKNSLRVIGRKTDKDEREYLAKGIAGRSFSRQFVLSDTVVVQWAELADGILSIALENVVPESQKPRKVEIKTPEALALEVDRAQRE